MGGSGGGSSSGEIDYPDYMKHRHQYWLDRMSTLIANTTSGASPFATATAYNPDSAVTYMLSAACNFETAVDDMEATTDFANAITNAITRFDALAETPTWVDPSPAAADEISADVDAFESVQDDHIENDILPRFKAGMRDINAVQTSSFVLGQAYIEASGSRDVAKYQGDLRTKAYLLKDELMAKSAIAENSFNLQLETDRRRNITEMNHDILQYMIQKIQFSQAVAHYLIEVRRMQIVAKKEQSDVNLLLDEQDAKWDLEAYQYGANMLGSIGGGTVTNSMSKASKISSALGGALSGAAAGTMVGSAVPGIGTAVGAAVGGIVGLAGGLLS
jgi:hypothetical protein